MSEIVFREERPSDAASVRAINVAAFDSPAEAGLVEALHAAGAMTLALVAEDAGEVVGHIAFSPVTIARAGAAPDVPSVDAIGLGPMAVRADRRGEGIGGALIRAGLDALRARGHGAVIVLGHPEYYPRFGFVRASTFGIQWERAVPDEVFMAIELRPHALADCAGVVRYRAEFDAV